MFASSSPRASRPPARYPRTSSPRPWTATFRVSGWHFAANLDTPTLAYTIVRITEGFLYSDIIADRSTDTDRAITVIEALLRGLDKSHRGQNFRS